MGKREILRAAKKRGITIVDAFYHWAISPCETYPEWQIEFGPELDDEIEFFGNSAEAIEFIENAALTTQHPEGGDQ